MPDCYIPTLCTYLSIYVGYEALEKPIVYVSRGTERVIIATKLTSASPNAE